MAHDIVRTVQTATLVALDQHVHGAIGASACHLPAVAFAHNQPAVEIERGPVAPLREADRFRRVAQRDAMQLIDAQIDEIPIIIRVPSGPSVKVKPVATCAAVVVSNTSGRSLVADMVCSLSHGAQAPERALSHSRV